MPVEPLSAEALLKRWHSSPALFAREALGLKLWSGQEAVINSVATSSRVAVRSGHKVGKSISAVAIALWFVACFPESRVIMTAPTGRQVKEVLWSELRKRYRSAPVSIGGRMNETPSGGLRFDDGRAIFGFSTDAAERLAGISGQNLLFVVDEASGVHERIYEAIEGNRAAGGIRTLLLSNPTQVTGTFHAAFHRNAHLWRGFHLKSTDTPNYIENRVVIPGLAGREWVEEKRAEWGADSPLFAVRVLGEFPSQSAYAIVSIAAVHRAHDIWMDTRASGRLEFGVDVARFGDDESVVCARRGKKVLSFSAYRGLDGQALAVEVLKLARTLSYPEDTEKPLVKVDTIGVGASVVDQLRGSRAIETVDVNVAQSATDPGYSNLRAQIAFAVRDWLKEGGALPPDDKLDDELVATNYQFDTQNRVKIEPKDAIKDRIGRSPDRADALGLALWTDGADIADGLVAPPLTVGSIERMGISLEQLVGAAGIGGGGEHTGAIVMADGSMRGASSGIDAIVEHQLSRFARGSG